MAPHDMVRQGSRMCIGDGEDTKAWEAQWLSCKENGRLTTDMPRQLEHIKVASMMATTKDRWDDDILQDICNERDAGLVKSIPLSIQGKRDSWYWIGEESGLFSVKSCYRKVHGEQIWTLASF